MLQILGKNLHFFKDACQMGTKFLRNYIPSFSFVQVNSVSQVIPLIYNVLLCSVLKRNITVLLLILFCETFYLQEILHFTCQTIF